MTGTQQVLLFVVIAALLTVCGVLWLEHRRHLADEQQFEDELNEQFGGHSETTATETLPPLPPEDLVGPDDGDPARTVQWPAPDAEADPVSQDLPAAVAAGSGAAADPAAGLTPAQRRRAVKKGRIPRNVPAVVGRESDTGHHSGARTSPALSPTAVLEPSASAAPGRAGEFHPHAECIPQPLEVYDPMMRTYMPVFPTLLESARHEAHFRQWESEMGSLIDGAYAWLETAA